MNTVYENIERLWTTLSCLRDNFPFDRHLSKSKTPSSKQALDNLRLRCTICEGRPTPGLLSVCISRPLVFIGQ